MHIIPRVKCADMVKADFMLDRSMAGLFEQDLDPRRIIRQVELRAGRRIDPGRTLIFFDEIQEAPHALTSLKYFCEQAREYHVAAAGSYMGIAMRREGESIPVGKVDLLTLRPLCFSEFLRAVAGDPMADALEAADMPALEGVSDLLRQRLKEYRVVGGMPEVVEQFRQTSAFDGVREGQLSILEDYAADFAKHAPARILERMRMVWASLPGQLAHESKKFVYGAVRPGGRACDFEESLQWLADYGAVHKVPRVSALRLPLAQYQDLAAFKLFCVDVGLLGALASLDPAAVTQGSRLFTEGKGALAEQYVAQELVCAGKSAAYWSSDTGTAETDFAIQTGDGVVPIEVKASENLRAKSLRVACEKFKLPRAVRTSLSPYRDDGWLVNIPLWAIGQIGSLA